MYLFYCLGSPLLAPVSPRGGLAYWGAQDVCHPVSILGGARCVRHPHPFHATTLGITFVNEAMQRRERDQRHRLQQEPHPLLQALEQVHREEREELRASHRGALRDLGARHDQLWEVQRELFRATRPHRPSEYQQQRQIEREEDVEADLGRQHRAEELTLQHSHTQQLRDLSQRQQQERSHYYTVQAPVQHAAPRWQPS
uniref:Uncharacterized protein n=1 Tax=Dunaliella tertiolecta TaxID=3047 RepID=A0A6S8JJF5_DUNTE|mmetsp:Transcript_23566/g.61291  ORF Transcript_23566/g.61291 Transcript_23566/m.61291 type:complete len:199 (-) Transcript_23566:761-1357(-)